MITQQLFRLIIAAAACHVAASGKERKEFSKDTKQSPKASPGGDDAQVSPVIVERGAPWSVVPETHISDTQLCILKRSFSDKSNL